MHAFIHPFIHAFIHPFIHSFIHSFIRFIHSVHSFGSFGSFGSFMHSFMHASIGRAPYPVTTRRVTNGRVSVFESTTSVFARSTTTTTGDARAEGDGVDDDGDEWKKKYALNVVDDASRAVLERAGVRAEDPLDEGAVRHAVETAKRRGNEAFGRKEYARAMEAYTTAIAGCDWDKTLYSNRSAAALALGLVEQALRDGGSASRRRRGPRDIIDSGAR